MIVPNETVVTNVVVNRSTGNLGAPAMASVWVPPNADIAPARDALSPLEPSAVDVAEVTPDGVRIEVHGPMRPGGTREAGEEAALRERAQRALRESECCRPDNRARYPFGFAMTARQRQTSPALSRGLGRQGRSCSPHGVVFVIIGIGIASAGLWVLDVAPMHPTSTP